MVHVPMYNVNSASDHCLEMIERLISSDVYNRHLYLPSPSIQSELILLAKGIQINRVSFPNTKLPDANASTAGL